MSRRLSACAARLEQTASLPCATQHTLRAFWTSCHLRKMDQSILGRGIVRRRMRPRIGGPSWSSFACGTQGGHGGKAGKGAGGPLAALVAFSHWRHWSSCSARTSLRQPLTRCERRMEPAATRKVCVATCPTPRRPPAVAGQRTEDALSNALTRSNTTAGFRSRKARTAACVRSTAPRAPCCIRCAGAKFRAIAAACGWQPSSRCCCMSFS
jgi:hypothetical protein